MNERVVSLGNSTLVLLEGDITVQNTQAVVNAANSYLAGGGGVDGAIHRAGGPEIDRECKKIIAERTFIPPGQAVITPGGNLAARFVIHAVGPVWINGRRNEEELLRDAYTNSLRIAEKKRLLSVSFPSISTGAYRFPVKRAAHIALSSIIAFLTRHALPAEVRMVLFSEDDFNVYLRELEFLAAR